MKTRMAGGRVAGVVLAVLGSGAVWAATPPAADPQVAREYRAQVTLDIDAGGQVAAVGLPAEVPSALAGPAREAVRRWRFKPPVRDGHPVSARTYARVTLQLLRQPDGNYGLRAIYGSNGPKLTFTQRPYYPPNELRRRNEGTLVLQAVVHPDGTVSDVVVASSRFSEPLTRDFRDSALALMKHCQGVPELVDGKPVATRIQVPVVYALQHISRGEALARQPAQNGPASDDPDSHAIGQIVALDSPVQRMTDPSG